MAGRVRDRRWRRFSPSPRPGQGAVAGTAAAISGGQPCAFIGAPRGRKDTVIPRDFSVVSSRCVRVRKKKKKRLLWITSFSAATKIRAPERSSSKKDVTARRRGVVSQFSLQLRRCHGRVRAPWCDSVRGLGLPGMRESERVRASLPLQFQRCLWCAPVSNVPDCQNHPGIRIWPRAAPLELWE